MKPVPFPEQTHVFGADQPEYEPLPAHAARDKFGTVITCWELTTPERLALLNTGRIYVHQLTFGGRLQPQLLQVFSPFGPDGKVRTP